MSTGAGTAGAGSMGYRRRELGGASEDVTGITGDTMTRFVTSSGASGSGNDASSSGTSASSSVSTVSGGRLSTGAETGADDRGTAEIGTDDRGTAEIGTDEIGASSS